MTDRKSRNRKIGALGENIASKYIENKGFCVVSRNYQKSWGELDIIAVKDGIPHFFEVKSVMKPFSLADSSKTHRPEENVHSFKVGQIRRMVKTYMFEHAYSPEQVFCFHVLCVYMDLSRRRAKVVWLKDLIL